MSDVWLDAKEESLKKALNKEAAIELVNYIMEVSEEIYCAGWMDGIENELWKALKLNHLSGYNPLLPRLKELQEKSGGWWYWDDELDGELFLTTEEWEKKIYV